MHLRRHRKQITSIIFPFQIQIEAIKQLSNLKFKMFNLHFPALKMFLGSPSIELTNSVFRLLIEALRRK